DRSCRRAAAGRRSPRADDLREAEAPGLQAGEPPGEPDEPDRRRRRDLPGRAFCAGEVAPRGATGAADRGWPVRAGAPRARFAADAFRLGVRSTTWRGTRVSTSPNV